MNGGNEFEEAEWDWPDDDDYEPVMPNDAIMHSPSMIEREGTIMHAPRPHIDPRHLPQIDLETASTWVYPTNYPKRDYQMNIVTSGMCPLSSILKPLVSIALPLTLPL